MWKGSEGHDRTNWNRFGDAKADLDSFLEKSILSRQGTIFFTICTTFTSCLNSCEYSYVGDRVGTMLGSWGSAVGSHFIALPLYRFVMLTRTIYTSITCKMEIKNNCFYTLHCIIYMSVNTATCI